MEADEEDDDDVNGMDQSCALPGTPREEECCLRDNMVFGG